jgi:cell division protein FtsN
MRDYAKRSFTEKPRKQRGRGRKIVLIAVAMLLLAGMYYVHHQKVIHHKSQVLAKKIVIKKAAQKAVLVAKPTFDFYTMLPKTGLTASSQKVGKYLLQVAAVQKKANAQVVQARLMHLGYAATMQNYTVSGVKIFRVLIGPYQTQKQALHDQKALAKRAIDSLLLTKSHN